MPDPTSLSAEDIQKIAAAVKALQDQDNGNAPVPRLTDEQKAFALKYAVDNFAQLERGSVVLHGTEIRGVGAHKQLNTFPVHHVYALATKAARDAKAEVAKVAPKADPVVEE